MTEPCAEWSTEVSALALGALSPEERIALLAHLDGCPACSTALAELRGSVSLLDRADPERIGALAPAPRGLDARVLEAVEGERARAARRRLVTRWGLAAAAAALVVAGGGALLSSRQSEPTPAGDVVALGDPARLGQPQVTATLTAKAWGTAVELVVVGSEPSVVYRVWLADAEGARTPAGTFMGADRTLTVATAAGLARPHAVAIGLSTDTGDPLVVASLPEAQVE